MSESKSSWPRLLVIASTYPRWQGDHEPGFVHELSKRLTSDFEVHVLCPHAPRTLGNEILDGVQVHRYRYAPAKLETLVQGGGIVNNLKHHPWKWLLVPLFMAGLAWNAGRLIRQLRPDCMHVHWIVPQGLALLLAGLIQKRQPPFLLTSHGGDLFGLRGAFMAHMKRWVIRHANAVSVVSRPMIRLALELGADPGRLAVIPMGVDFEGRFTPGNGADRKAGEILFVGRLVEKKGIKYLLQVMPMVIAQVPHAHLTIAGYGPEEKNLHKLAASLNITDKVTFLGATPQQELPALYRRASVFVAPFVQAGSGDQEGLPVALMEAIACGCPVVVGDLEVLDDIFQSDEADMRVASQDIHALAERVIMALGHTDTACHRAENMRQRLEQQLRWGTITRRYAEVLQGISSPNRIGST
jgi:glycosyltransferase involved in cell wall biosynthesis